MHARRLLIALMVLSLAGVSSAQLSGNYTVDPSGSGSRNYTTFAAAASALASGGVSGPVVFAVAPTTFNEVLSFNSAMNASATNTITFIAATGPAVVKGGSSTAITLNSCRFFVFENIQFETTSGSYCVYCSQADDNTFRYCKFTGGNYVVYSQGMDRGVFDGCELDGKGTATRLLAPYNANDSDCLFQNCFMHDCSPTGLGAYINVSGYGIMFWHNTIIVTTSQNAVHLGGCCAWSRANSFRNNIVINLGSGVAIKYGFTGTVLEYNDADFNCYFAPFGNACELENGSGFTKGTLAAWQAYFNTNRATLVPQTGSTPWPTPAQARWDDNSIEMDPALISMNTPYDIHLSAGSPCRDAGTITYVAGAWISYNASYIVLNDFEGEIRPLTNVDMGADEATNTALTLSGTGKIGTAITLLLDAGTPDAGLPYQLGSALNDTPAIPIDTRFINLAPDTLLVVSVTGLLPGIFANYTGVLDAAGKATAAINIPNIPALDQIRLYTAFVTVKVGAPSNIQTVSNTVMFTILN